SSDVCSSDLGGVLLGRFHAQSQFGCPGGGLQPPAGEVAGVVVALPASVRMEHDVLEDVRHAVGGFCVQLGRHEFSTLAEQPGQAYLGFVAYRGIGHLIPTAVRPRWNQRWKTM